MTLTKNAQSNLYKGEIIWGGAETLSAGVTGDAVLIPEESGKIETWLVGLFITSGTGKVQYSISPRAEIESGNGNWRDWDNGSVSSTNDDALYPVNAVRAVCTAGEIIFEVAVL